MSEELNVAKQMIEKANAILVKHGQNPASTSTSTLSDAQWNYVNQTDPYNGEIEWKVWKTQFEYKLELLTKDEKCQKTNPRFRFGT